MWGKPFGSGGKRVLTARPKRPEATSTATISRITSLGVEASWDTGNLVRDCKVRLRTAGYRSGIIRSLGGTMHFGRPSYLVTALLLASPAAVHGQRAAGDSAAALGRAHSA